MARNKYPEETVKLILDVSEKLFLEKGYDSTSIQDIINGLGGLSKGAVYHHFSSKEDIFNAVADRYNAQVVAELRELRDSPELSGYEKLKKMYQLSVLDADRDLVYVVCPNMLENPRLLSAQVKEIFADVAPNYVQPILEQGLRDGSIKTDYPKEFAEVITLLTNIWLNPTVIEADPDTMERRVRFFNELLKSMGVELMDEQMLQSYRRYCEIFRENHN